MKISNFQLEAIQLKKQLNELLHKFHTNVSVFWPNAKPHTHFEVMAIDDK